MAEPITNTLELIDAAHQGILTLDDVMEDGKINLMDLLKVEKAFKAITLAVDQFDQIPAELTDVDNEEAQRIAAALLPCIKDGVRVFKKNFGKESKGVAFKLLGEARELVATATAQPSPTGKK